MSKPLLAFLIALAFAIIVAVIAIPSGKYGLLCLSAAALFTGIVCFARGEPRTTDSGVMAVYSGLPWWVWVVDGVLLVAAVVLMFVL
jgi:hypothetical protein